MVRTNDYWPIRRAQHPGDSKQQTVSSEQSVREARELRETLRNSFCYPVIWLGLVGMALLLACQGSALPTREIVGTLAAATLPPLPTSSPPPVPPTYTPRATPSPAPTPLPTSTPSPTPHWTTTCTTPSQIVTGVFPDALAGPERAYRAYLPPCYGQDGRLYPVLYLFHGTYQDDSFWEQMGVAAAADELILSRQIPPIVILMPYSATIDTTSSGGPYSWEGVVLNYLLPFAETTYCVGAEPRWRAMGGLSRGGYWALEIAFQHPELFASVGAHSGALEDTAAGSEINPKTSWQGKNLVGLRLYLDTGETDWYRVNFEQLHEDLAAANIPHEWHLNEGTHDTAYWSSHVSDYLLWYTAIWPRERGEYPVCQENSGNS